MDVPGLTAVFIGPYDLSGSVGKLGKVNDPEIQDMVKKVADVSRKAGLPVGIFGMDVEVVSSYLELGYTLIAAGMDTSYLTQSVHATLRAIRDRFRT